MRYSFEGVVVDTDTYELRAGDAVVDVEPQVFDVLVHLIAHRDRVVTKEELLDNVWGDRFVSESALTTRIKQARRAVGDDGQAQRVIKTVLGRGYRFVTPVAELPAAGDGPQAEVAAAAGDAGVPPGPKALDDQLIGRGGELDRLTARLSERRLVTVIGPGGIGKTALARAAAARLEASFVRGSFVVDLTRVESPEAVGEAMSGQLGFPSFQALLDSPSDQSALLLVDNCEHVTDAAAEAIAALLDACRSPTVLATSRSPLDLPGEAVVVVGPLALPAPGAADAAAPAVRLFSERARDAGASVGDAELETVGELCRRLDGVPLALELAAARSRSLTPTEMIARLDDGLDILARPRFRGARRHRSLRDTIAWSYRMLDDADARLFNRLGVFAGPFTVSMAHAVASDQSDQSDPGGDELRTLDQLDTLVAASLLAVDRDGPTTRYRLLETLRAFAVERLEATGERAGTWERFVAHVDEVAAAIFERAHRGWHASVQAELLDLFDNLAAAVRWCVANDAEPVRALRLVAVMWGVVHQTHTAEVATLGEQVLARWPEARSPLWADAVATVATCRFLLGRPGDAVALAEQALPEADAAQFAAVTLRRVMGQARRALGETDTPLDLFTEAAAEGRARGLDSLAMELDTMSAQVLGDTGRIDDALARLRAVHSEAAASGSDLNQMLARSTEGNVLLRRDLAAASAAISDALAAARRLGHHAVTSTNLRSLALARLAEGEVDEAAQLALELLDELAATGDLTELRAVLDTTAAVLERAGREAWSVVAASAEALPAVSLTAGVCHDLFPLPDHRGHALPPRDAITEARTELRALARQRPAVTDKVAVRPAG